MFAAVRMVDVPVSLRGGQSWPECDIWGFRSGFETFLMMM